MKSLAAICIVRPVFASMLILALVVVGAASWFGLGVDRFPAVDLPTVRVRTILPGASPEEIEVQVSQRIEEAVNTVEGINELRSVSAAGISLVIATFELDRDIDAATQDVRDRVAAVVSRLPVDAQPPVIAKADNDQAPVVTIAVTANRPLRELTELADKVVKVQLERARGVGEVTLVGGLERAINVWVEADRLAAYRLPITTVRSALVRQNADLPGGNVTQQTTEQTLRTMGRLTDPTAFNDLVLTRIDGAPIRVRDVGFAEDGTKEQRSLSRLDGVPTVILEVRRQSGANTVAVIEAVRANMARAQAQLPPDVSLEVIRDQSRYIYNALHEINVHLVLGSVFACLVVFVFMRNWRSTLIAGVAIPASVIATFGMMRALDFTLNSVTMLALVLMVGIVIDDAIVVLENIFRFVEEKKLEPFAAAREATAEIALPVMATTFSLAVIFIPVSFMSSVSGRFLYQFGITAAVAIMVSLLVSFTLTPMMSARLLRGGGGAHGGGQAARSRAGFYATIDAVYTGLLQWSMERRPVVLGLAATVALSSIPLYGLVRQEYVPSDVDEAEFEMSVTAREGTSLASMNQALEVVEREVRTVPGVRLVLASVGGSFLGAVNQGTLYVRIAPHEERVLSIGRVVRSLLRLDPLEAFRGNYSQRQVMQEIRRRMRAYPDLRTSVRNIQAFNLGGGPWDVDFAIRGPELEPLAGFAEALRRRAPELGLVDADTTLKLDKPELRVEIDRARAADLGVDTQDIAAALRLMVGGDQEVTRFRDAAVNDDYDVQLRLVEGDRNDRGTIAQLFVPRQGGGVVRLDNVVRIVDAESPSRIDRLDRQRVVNVRGGVAPGFAQGDRVATLRQEVASMNLPPAYSTSVTGKSRELERTAQEFVWAFLLSIAFMYMILAAQFESTVHPLTILLSLPIAIPFALLSLWATGNTLNLYSSLGLLVLFGVVKKNAILQIDHMNNLRRAGMARLDAILQANRDRLRPILMTTLSLVAGMTPLALGTGPGAEERRTIAVVVIGGQMLSLLLTLLVTPVAYSTFDDIGRSFAWRRLSARARALLPWWRSPSAGEARS
ncbi:MAG: efflux RND transporter permease subunit [Acidobacteria bacterium]|nr:efflux RND transporter permease subunit [Acidobacteriota bacterium]